MKTRLTALALTFLVGCVAHPQPTLTASSLAQFNQMAGLSNSVERNAYMVK